MIRIYFLWLAAIIWAVLFCAEEVNSLRGIRGIGEMVDGKKQGVWIYRNEDNGKPVIIGNHKEGVPNGVWCEFHDDGSIERIGIYKDGFPDGEWVLFHRNGVISSRGFFGGGKRMGVWTSFDEDGNLVGTINQ